MSALLKNLPAANSANAACSNPRSQGCSTNFQIPNGHGDNYHALTVRIDHNLSSTEKLFASYEDGYRLEFIDNPGGPAGLFPLTNTWRGNHGATFNLSSILSPTFISTFKVNWLRANGTGFSSPLGATPSSIGLSPALSALFGANNFPGVSFSSSTVNYTGFSQGGRNTTTLSDNWTAQETLSKVWNNHSLKWGGLATITTENNQAANQIPTLNFGDVFTRQIGRASCRERV